MKPRFAIAFLLVSALLTACVQRHDADSSSVGTRHGTSLPPDASPELAAIDSLMWQQPDSALTCLIAYFNTCCRDTAHLSTLYNSHYAHLLLAELLYKNDYAQTNRAELQQAVAYFDSLCHCTDVARNVSTDNAFLDARAHYINGVGFYKRDSVVEACKEYITALETTEERFKEKDLFGQKAQFMALTYTHLTGLFSDQYLHEQAIYFGKSSLHYYKKYKALPWHIAWILDEIGSQYDMMDYNDTAYRIYTEAMQILPDTNNITYRDIATHLFCLSYKIGGSPEISLNLLYAIINKSESDKEYFSRCMNIGEIFYHETQFDSAWYYLDKVFLESPNVNSKKQAAEWLAKMCKTQGKEADAIKYADFLVPFANVEENQSAVKSQLTELYKRFAQREQERMHRQEKMKNQRWLMVVVGGLLVLMSSFIILYHTSRKKKQHLETQIETERQAHSMQQKALSGKLKKSNKALHDALQQLDDNSAFSEIQSESKKDYISFMDAPICRHILETAHKQRFKSKIEYVNYKEHALQREQLLALRMAADENMDNFTVRIKKRFHGLTDEDATYCCLYLLGITDADIAALMQKAYPTVCERKRKIRRIVGGESSLTYTLRNLP